MTAPTVRQAKILRVLELMHALKTAYQSIEDIARIIDISSSTAVRYVRLLEQLGIDVKSFKKRNNGKLIKVYYIEQCPCCGKI